MSVAVATGDGQAAWIDVADIGPDDDAAVAAWLADPARPKALHDANGPSLALAARGWELAGLDVDTALAAYLVQPDQRSYDLADLTLRYLKRELRQDTTDADQLSFDALDDTTASDTRDAHRARRPRPGRRARRGRRGARRHPAAAATSSSR